MLTPNVTGSYQQKRGGVGGKFSFGLYSHLDYLDFVFSIYNEHIVILQYQKKKKVKTQNLLSKGRFSMAEHSHMTSEADAADAGSPKGSGIRTDRLGRTLADQ